VVLCTAVPGPVLRELGYETGDRRVPQGITKGTAVACEPSRPFGPHAEYTTRAPLGIPWAEKWRSVQIVRKCCNPDTGSDGCDVAQPFAIL
jgi:hypothetical protein